MELPHSGFHALFLKDFLFQEALSTELERLFAILLQRDLDLRPNLMKLFTLRGYN